MHLAVPRPKIVVITPVRNEAWILPMFLATCSTFADHILILDQASTDESRDICGEFPKAVILDNPSTAYNEEDRQILLIEAARRLVPGPRLLLALDADEPMAADAMSDSLWERILSSPPGTSVFFQKVNLTEDPNLYILSPGLFALGFMDNDEPHISTAIHSQRLPMGKFRLEMPEIHILHYGLTRPRHQQAKMRMYCCLEKVFKTSSWHGRRFFYSSTRNYAENMPSASPPVEWTAGWERMGIKMEVPSDNGIPWQDFEVLRLFSKYGTRKFWSEPVWDYDWEVSRAFAQASGLSDIPANVVEVPPLFYRKLLAKIDVLLAIGRGLRKESKRLSVKQSKAGA